MKMINVRDVYTVDTISSANSEAWQILQNIASSLNESVLFDFDGILLVSPWKNYDFKKLMADEKVSIKIHSAAKDATTIKMMAAIDSGFKNLDKRVINVEAVVVPKITPEQQEIIDDAVKMQSLFMPDANGAIMAMQGWGCDYISGKSTIDSMHKAIEMFSNNTGCKNIAIDTGSISIQDNMLQVMANMIMELEKNGINVCVIKTLDNKDKVKKIEDFKVFSLEKMPQMDKYNLIKNELRPGHSGVLVTYRDGRAKDAFGRSGKGAYQSVLPAIFLGYSSDGDNIWLKFRQYSLSTFYTPEHWALEHDGDQLDHMQYSNIKVTIDDIGYSDKFLGRHYYFQPPIQMKPEDTSVILSSDQAGSILYNNVTMPMRMKTVFDSWGIKYDEANLNESISITDRILANL